MESPRPASPLLPAYWPFKGVFYGWAIVGTAVLVSCAQVPMYGPVLSLFMKPVGDDMGWSRGELSIAFTAGSLFGSLTSSLVGLVLDRYGARMVVVIAGMIITGALIGLVVMQELWQFWLFYGAGRTAANAGINLGVSVAVANWFIRKRGRTLSLLAIGLRSGQALFPLFLTPIIVLLTWRHAFGVLAVIAFLFIVIPAWLFLRRRPEDFGLLPDGDEPHADRREQTPGDARQASAPNAETSWTLSEARRTLAFWLLIIATMVTIFGQTAVNLHAVASFDDRGIADGFSGMFVFLFAGTAAISAYGWGWFMDRFHVRSGTILATLLSAASMLVIIVAEDIFMGILFALLFGAGMGGWTVSQNLLFAVYFGRAHLGSIRGVSLMIAGPVGAAGPLMAGFLHDFTGSYALSFQIFFIAFLVVAAALFFARPPRRQARA